MVDITSLTEAEKRALMVFVIESSRQAAYRQAIREGVSIFEIVRRKMAAEQLVADAILEAFPCLREEEEDE